MCSKKEYSCSESFSGVAAKFVSGGNHSRWVFCHHERVIPP